MRTCCCHSCCCPTAIPVRVYGFAASVNFGPIQVVPGGTDIPLPSDVILSDGITLDPSNRVFTVAEPGVYRIVYHVNLEGEENVNTRLMLNGNPITASVLFPVAPEDRFAAEVLVHLVAGDQISLQMFNADQSIHLQLGVGASLSIVKES